MDFDAAIKTHSHWKLKLKHYIDNPDGSIDVEKLRAETECTLGKWLKGSESDAYKNIPEFIELINVHADFHKQAADIVIRRNKGESVQEEVVIGAKSPFSLTSSKVISLLMSLRQKTAVH